MSARRRPRPTLVAAIAVGTVLALLVVLLATRSTGPRDSDSAPIEGKAAPAVGGKVILGEPFDIGASDRWVVVNFFATWCGPCIREHPELKAFVDEHRTAGDARVVSVVYDQNPQVVRDWFAERGGEWTVLDADEGRTAFDWGVTGVPESYLVSPTGIVVKRIRGGVTQRDLDQLIDAYTKQANAEGTGS